MNTLYIHNKSYSVYIQLLDLQKVAAISQVLTILYAGPWYNNLLTGNLIIFVHFMVCGIYCNCIVGVDGMKPSPCFLLAWGASGTM